MQAKHVLVLLLLTFIRLDVLHTENVSNLFSYNPSVHFLRQLNDVPEMFTFV